MSKRSAGADCRYVFIYIHASVFLYLIAQLDSVDHPRCRCVPLTCTQVAIGAQVHVSDSHQSNVSPECSRTNYVICNSRYQFTLLRRVVREYVIREIFDET